MWQWISVNPADHATKPPLPHPEPKPPTVEEAARLMERAWSKDPDTTRPQSTRSWTQPATSSHASGQPHPTEPENCDPSATNAWPPASALTPP
jgi:hypothetical protein